MEPITVRPQSLFDVIDPRRRAVLIRRLEVLSAVDSDYARELHTSLTQLPYSSPAILDLADRGLSSDIIPAQVIALGVVLHAARFHLSVEFVDRFRSQIQILRNSRDDTVRGLAIALGAAFGLETPDSLIRSAYSETATFPATLAAVSLGSRSMGSPLVRGKALLSLLSSSEPDDPRFRTAAVHALNELLISRRSELGEILPAALNLAARFMSASDERTQCLGVGILISVRDAGPHLPRVRELLATAHAPEIHFNALALLMEIRAITGLEVRILVGFGAEPGRLSSSFRELASKASGHLKDAIEEIVCRAADLSLNEERFASLLDCAEAVVQGALVRSEGISVQGKIRIQETLLRAQGRLGLTGGPPNEQVAEKSRKILRTVWALPTFHDPIQDPTR